MLTNKIDRFSYDVSRGLGSVHFRTENLKQLMENLEEDQAYEKNMIPRPHEVQAYVKVSQASAPQGGELKEKEEEEEEEEEGKRGESGAAASRR
ncbi:hypothetical protein PpBr36_01851 [Pyricularia pennisetigena]|uniref:hypothetical protein n=1 Tax=Pyricularia pennisetigena TaxID=1578925 RepID=UPI00114E16CA|nr:hypothetical protein PpBr36_01851 [Pyricularia pennisetigena]TLS29837.1 hypothetical protein PpBr36_01851 [Pyricularia pennisetigena]